MIKKTLYFGNPIYLSTRLSQLVLHLPEVEDNEAFTLEFRKEASRTIPIEDIGVVVLDNKRITITWATVRAILRKGNLMV